MRWIAVLVLIASSAIAQAPQAPSAPPVKVNQADVKSMDSILAALYDVISGPAGQKRDWDRFRSLFLPGARLIPTGRRATGQTGIHVLTPDDYVANTSPYLEKEGFYEREIARHADQYGAIAQVFSTYESRHKPGEAPFARGINSIQLLNDGQRWWVVTVLWANETPQTPLPPPYLPGGKLTR